MLDDMEPVWMLTARREIGVKEVPGGADHPRIIEYLRECKLIPALLHDETAWCSAYVNFVMDKSGFTPTRSAAARSWLHWGKSLDEPQKGCIVVLTRPGKPGFGHVGFYVGEVGDKVLLLGGNQNNKVCVQAYDKDRVLSYRWPIV